MGITPNDCPAIQKKAAFIKAVSSIPDSDNFSFRWVQFQQATSVQLQFNSNFHLSTSSFQPDSANISCCLFTGSYCLDEILSAHCYLQSGTALLLIGLIYMHLVYDTNVYTNKIYLPKKNYKNVK